MPLLSFSQADTLPRLSVINGVQCVIISLNQLDSANVTCIKLDQCEEVKDTLVAQNRRYQDALAEAETLLIAEGERNALNERIKGEQRNQITGWVETDKKNRKHIKWLVFQRNALVGIVVAGIGIFILHY